MACERDRILKLQQYLSDLGIVVNISKNKARGHNGIFMSSPNLSRIDISKNVEEEKILSVMLHEFAHYIHHSYDKKMHSLNFLFDDFTDELREELINITIHSVPKNFAQAVYSKRENLQSELKELSKKMQIFDSDYKLTNKNAIIEKKLPCPIKYLLSYDRVNYFNKIYSIDKLNEYNLDEKEKIYIIIKSKQRALKRITSRISRINRYYKQPSELFARFIDSFYTNPNYTKQIAPNACKYLYNSNITFLKTLNNIFEVSM